MTNHHDDYGVMIQLLVDDELAGLERESLISHIIDCPNCQKELKEAQVFSARVRSARPQVEAPEGLREKILSNVNNSSSQSIRAYWRPLAAAAMFVIARGVVLSLSFSGGNHAPRVLSRQRSPNIMYPATVDRSMWNRALLRWLLHGLRSESRFHFGWPMMV